LAGNTSNVSIDYYSWYYYINDIDTMSIIPGNAMTVKKEGQYWWSNDEEILSKKVMKYEEILKILLMKWWKWNTISTNEKY